MTEQRVFQVGDHTFNLDSPKGMLSEKELEPYAPFRTDYYSGNDSLFTLTLIEDRETLESESPLTADLEDENGRMTIFTHADGGMTFNLHTVSGTECGRIRISENYQTANAWIGGSGSQRRYALNTALMLLYTFAAANHATLMLHASTVEYQGKGYLFLGKSGTGKSTHSRLWAEYIEGSELLNDDNPIVRLIDGTAYVYGSPWSGKTPCYRNHRSSIGGIVRLKQAPCNNITRLESIKAYAALLPSCSCMKWRKEIAGAVHDTVSKILDLVPVYGLECLPDREAAQLCFNTLTGSND